MPSDERSAASTPQRPGAGAPDVRLAMSLPATIAAPGDARRAVQLRLGDLLATRALDDLLLVVSELVTNALRHGRGDIGLRVTFDGERVAGTVSDDGHGFAYHPTGPDPTSHGGRGLNLVGQLTTRWGLRPASSDVWFEMRTCYSL
jgi:two-component sensor histidine kinase